MKKYYYQDSIGNQYSNDTSIDNVQPIKSIYYCNEVVNKNPLYTYDGNALPWFCIKDGDMCFASGFKMNDTSTKITRGPEKNFYRRILSCTFDCLTDAWMKSSDTSWVATNTAPFINKKELYVGDSPLINLMDRKDENGNIIGNKLSWRTSVSNFKFIPAEGDIKTSTTWYIEKNSYMSSPQFYNGSPDMYTDTWGAFHLRRVFTTKEAAEHIYNSIPTPDPRARTSYWLKIEHCDPDYKWWNYNNSNRCVNMGGFNGWSTENAASQMFTTNNYHAIKYRPTFKENFTGYDSSIAPDAYEAKNTNPDDFEINNYVLTGTNDGPSPSYFTLDISKVPMKYNKIDIVIDGVFYYPTNNSYYKFENPSEDYSDVYNTYNYGRSPIDSTKNCWSYIYKPDNSETWNYMSKYTITAKVDGSTRYYGWVSADNTNRQISPDATYDPDAWWIYPNKLSYNRYEYATAFKEIIDNAGDTSITNVGLLDVNTLAGLPYSGYSFPSADYLGYGFFSNLKYDSTIQNYPKTPWYSDDKSKYTLEHYLLYDNSDVEYNLEDKNLLDKMFVYCVNNNNDGICKWEIRWDNGTTSTGYSLWADIYACRNCSNLYVTAYSGAGTMDLTDIKNSYTQGSYPDHFTSAKFDDINVIDYNKFFPNNGGTCLKSLKDLFGEKDWKTISSKFIYFGAYDSYYETNKNYMYGAGTRGTAAIRDYGYQGIPSQILYKKNYSNNKWNKYGFMLSACQLLNIQSVTMKHQIDLGDRTTTGGFTFTGDRYGDYRYLHISYPDTNVVNNGNKAFCHLTQADMYYKFTN